MNIEKKLRPITLSLLLAGSIAAVPALAGEAGQEKAYGEDRQEDMEDDVREAWMEGKLESAFLFNRHLNNFTINPEVNGDTVVLIGKVESDVDRDLAEEIATDVDGIEHVTNKLEVVEHPGKETARESMDSFASRVEDATLTAEVKMSLLANSNTEGLDINVDTDNRVVTLKGEVASDEEKALAERLAADVDGVTEVVSELTVKN